MHDDSLDNYLRDTEEKKVIIRKYRDQEFPPMTVSEIIQVSKEEALKDWDYPECRCGNTCKDKYVIGLF